MTLSRTAKTSIIAILAVMLPLRPTWEAGGRIGLDLPSAEAKSGSGSDGDGGEGGSDDGDGGEGGSDDGDGGEGGSDDSDGDEGGSDDSDGDEGGSDDGDSSESGNSGNSGSGNSGSGNSGSGSSGSGSSGSGSSGSGDNVGPSSGSTVARVAVSASGIEVRYSDGSRERIRNGQYELRDSTGRKVASRRATGPDISRMRAISQRSTSARSAPPLNPVPSGATRISIRGRNISVDYANGWHEEVQRSTYTLKDNYGRTVVRRRASEADMARLRGLAGR